MGKADLSLSAVSMQLVELVYLHSYSTHAIHCNRQQSHGGNDRQHYNIFAWPVQIKVVCIVNSVDHVLHVVELQCTIMGCLTVQKNHGSVGSIGKRITNPKNIWPLQMFSESLSPFFELSCKLET